jgi:four helix bundle protein
MRNFRNFKIRAEAIQVSKTVYQITLNFPPQEKYGLCNQMQRSSVSIASNIAEGAS